MCTVHTRTSEHAHVCNSIYTSRERTVYTHTNYACTHEHTHVCPAPLPHSTHVSLRRRGCTSYTSQAVQ